MPIKVLHIITRMILGGAQENTLFTCEGLHKSPKWDVTLLCGPPIGPEGELLRRAEDGGIRTIVLPDLRRELNPRRDIKSFARILSHIKAVQPHIVHTHSSKAGILGRFAAHLARVPVTIHTIHGLPFHPYQSRWENELYIALEKAAARCSDHIVCVADAMRRQALDAGIGRKEQYSVVYSGMDVEPYTRTRDRCEIQQIRRQLGFGPGDIVVAKIARLFDLKGHQYVIEAAPAAIKACPEVRFLFVGDGTLRSRLERMTEELGVADHFCFTGLMPPSRIPEFVAASDMLVHASLREGLPRVAVQALLGAKPVICFDTDGAPEVVIDGVTGRLVTPGSVSGLAGAITELALDPHLAERMGTEGRQRCITPFKAETMVEELEQLYMALDF